MPEIQARRASRPRGATRQRVLDTALHLFAERGYAGTSIRDIADELEFSKAAVHYHFAAKGQLAIALLEPVLQEYAELLDGAPLRPRELLRGVRDLLVAHGPLLSVLASDPSVAAASADLHRDLTALGVRTAQVLAGADASPERLLRAHCSLGALFAGWDSAFRGLAGRPAGGRVSSAELDVVLTAALAALGR